MSKSDRVDQVPVRTLGLLLIDGFALMSYASVIEPFRAANTLAGRALYRWTHISVDGHKVSASNGASILADHAVGDPMACDTLFVFAAGDPAQFSDIRTFAWLGVSPVRMCGWPAFREARFCWRAPACLPAIGRRSIGTTSPLSWKRFPTLAIEPGLYVIDRRRLTCAGGTAGLDLAIELIEREHGHKLAAQVSEWFIRTEPRPAGKSQRLSLRERVGISNDRVLRVLAKMEETLEEPAGMQELAKLAGVSLRQLKGCLPNIYMRR